MILSKFINTYDLHDSIVEEINYYSTERKIIMLVNLCNWRQKTYIEGEPEVVLVKVFFSAVSNLSVDSNITELHDAEILKADVIASLTDKRNEILKLVLHNGEDVNVLEIEAMNVTLEQIEVN